MKAIKPTAVTAAVLVSTNATESIAAWAAGTAYAADDQALLADTQRIYQRIVAGTTATAPNLDTTNWLDIGPTNKYAMFDNEVSTQTIRSSSLTVVLKVGYTNSVALFGLEGDSVTVTLRDSLAGSVVYGPHTLTLDGTVISDWYQYFYEPSVQLGEVVLTDLPPYANGHLTVAITSSTIVKCGVCAVGTFYDLGALQYGATVGIIDYSTKTTDEFGNTLFVERAFSKRLNAQLSLSNPQINKVQRVLASLRATPCAWLGVEEPGYEPLSVFGYYKDFSIDVRYFDTSYCSLEIEGLT